MKQAIGKTYTILLSAALLLPLVAGCVNEETSGKADPRLQGGQTVEASVLLTVINNRVPATRHILMRTEGTIDTDAPLEAAEADEADAPQTRAANLLTQEQEEKIEKLWVGQYEAETGVLLQHEYHTGLSTNTLQLKLKSNVPGTKSRIYFVANTIDLGAIATEEALKKRRHTFGATADGLPTGNLIPMMGTWEGEVLWEGAGEIKADMTRLAARISFTYSMEGNFRFTPASVKLMGVPSHTQIAIPTGQLAGDGLTYGEYTGTDSRSGATMHWYLPENNAGDGTVAAATDKNKAGTGVQNATYIEMKGRAMHNIFIYEDVTFRFYPGGGNNNYDLLRNTTYTMVVKLEGIDASDERITVDHPPTVSVEGGRIGAAIGSQKTGVKIPVRPGVKWQMEMPPWLKSFWDNPTGGRTTVPQGATVSFHEPVELTFEATQANPYDHWRGVDIPLKVTGHPDQTLTIEQAGSTLVAASPGSKLNVNVSNESTYGFTATSGLPWTASITAPGDNWISWGAGFAPGMPISGTGTQQQLRAKARNANPYGNRKRTGEIIIRGGASAPNSAYDGLKLSVAVEQDASRAVGSDVTETRAAGYNGITKTFWATAGLEWYIKDGDVDSWLKVTGGGSNGTLERTGGFNNPQTVTFNIKPNPNKDARGGKITISVGDPTDGPKAVIAVNQLPSTFTVNPATELPFVLGGEQKNVTVTATPNLKVEVTRVPFTQSEVAVFPTETVKASAGDISFTTARLFDTTGSNQSVSFRAKPNNTENNRLDRFSFRIADGDHLPKYVIMKQGGIFLRVGPRVTLDAKAQSSNVSFSTPPGRRWTASVPQNSWIKITSANQGGAVLGSGNVSVPFSVGVNPSKDPRPAGGITINNNTSSKTIEVTQAGSVFDIPTTKILLNRHSGATATVNVAPSTTAGLELVVRNVSSNNPNDAPRGVIAGNNRSITFRTVSSSSFSSARRTRTFAVSIKDGNHPEKLIEVEQLRRQELELAPGHVIEVEQTENSIGAPYDRAVSVCNQKGGGWRLPTIPELHAMYNAARRSDSKDATSLANHDSEGNRYSETFGVRFQGEASDGRKGYWSSTPVSNSLSHVYVICFKAGLQQGFVNGQWVDVYDQRPLDSIESRYIRCVRDAN